MAITAMLDGAFALQRQPAAAAPAPGAAPPAPIPAAPVPGSGDDISASIEARLLTIGVLAAGVLIALFLPEHADKAFKPAAGFGALAGFYIAAQAIERLLELLPAGKGTKQAKADRAVIFSALGFILAIGVSEVLHLYLVSAVGSGAVNLNLDVVITALAIGGGTKPLHDGIKLFEKAKETPPATT